MSEGGRAGLSRLGFSQAGAAVAYSHSEAVSFIWGVCNIIRDQGYHQSDYGDLILPFTVLRRLDAAAADDRDKARQAHDRMTERGADEEVIHKHIEAVVGKPYYSVAAVGFDGLLDDPNNLEANLRALVDGFSPNVREALSRFDISFP